PGLLFVFQSKAACEHYAATDRLLRDRFALPAERYDADALLALEPALKPGSAAGGYLYRSDAQLRPDRLMSGWRAVLDRLGVTVLEGSTLLGFVREGGTAVAARTTRGDLTASHFVVAAGAWTP